MRDLAEMLLLDCRDAHPANPFAIIMRTFGWNAEKLITALEVNMWDTRDQLFWLEDHVFPPFDKSPEYTAKFRSMDRNRDVVERETLEESLGKSGYRELHLLYNQFIGGNYRTTELDSQELCRKCGLRTAFERNGFTVPDWLRK